MLIYYFISSLILFACLFEFSRNVQTKKNVIIVLCITFTIFGGIRWGVGNDWPQYLSHFQRSSWHNIFNYDRYRDGSSTLEPGFVFLNVIIKSIFKTFYWYNLLTLAFIQFTYYRFSIYFSPKRPLLLYCFFVLINPNFFAVRAGLATTVALWAYKFVKEQNLKGFLVIALLAFSIHMRSIAILPIYWFRKININFTWALGLFALFAIVGYEFQSYFQQLAMVIGGDVGEMAYSYTIHESTSYAAKTDKTNFQGWGLNLFFMCVYFYIMYEKKIKNNEWYNFLIITFIMHIATFMVFSEGMGNITRISALFFPAQAILFSYAMNFFLDTKKGQQYRYAAIAFFIAYFIYKLPSHWSGFWFKETCLPYKTIFDYNLF